MGMKPPEKVANNTLCVSLAAAHTQLRKALGLEDI